MSQESKNPQVTPVLPGTLLSPGRRETPSLTAPFEDDVDANLVRRCLRNDRAAFGALVARHENRIRALVARILGATATPDDVDDVAQDVFVQAWRALPRFRGDARFSTWLYRIATNRAIREWHRLKRSRHDVSTDALTEDSKNALVSGTASPAEEAARRAENRAVRQAIDALPEKQRTVVLLHYFEDYACEEIAQIAGCSVGTVWSRLHYACRKLQKSLESDE